ncbi:hypothetical protein EI94DRAFT_1447770, partial [Lactarius quietus]
GTYQRWCKSADFLSMIPEDAKAMHQVNTNAKEQTQVDNHFNQANPEDRPPVYLDGLFKDVAIRWLIKMDQLVSVFDHPSFQSMINVVARATRGIHIPNRLQTRGEIILLFKAQMNKLKVQLNV